MPKTLKIGDLFKVPFPRRERKRFRKEIAAPLHSVDYMDVRIH